MKNIVVFTGAGISAESGLATFRGKGGLWKKYRIEDVATQESFKRNPKLVLDFYNFRRKQLLNSQPNNAHFSLNRLQVKYNLCVITQNIDDLHERSGTKNVIHLHGKLTESRSTIDNVVYKINGAELNIDDNCEEGGQLRPNVVWFGEEVANMDLAIDRVQATDVFIIIGTSLKVFPAASLIRYVKDSKRIILVDPNASSNLGIEIIKEKATEAVPKLVDELIENLH